MLFLLRRRSRKMRVLILVFVFFVSLQLSANAAEIRQCVHGEMRGGCIRKDGSYYRQEEAPIGRKEIRESNLLPLHLHQIHEHVTGGLPTVNLNRGGITEHAKTTSTRPFQKERP